MMSLTRECKKMKMINRFAKSHCKQYVFQFKQFDKQMAVKKEVNTIIPLEIVLTIVFIGTLISYFNSACKFFY